MYCILFILQHNDYKVCNGSLVSKEKADPIEEPLSPLPDLRRRDDSSSDNGYQPQPGRRMSLFTEGVPALPLLPTVEDEEVKYSDIQSLYHTSTVHIPVYIHTSIHTYILYIPYGYLCTYRCVYVQWNLP